jgi:hypothetical protein
MFTGREIVFMIIRENLIDNTLHQIDKRQVPGRGNITYQKFIQNKSDQKNKKKHDW